MELQVESISIHKRQSYEGGTGEYVGELKITGQYGNVAIQLDKQLSAEVLKLCAAALTRATQELATSMTAQIFEQAANNLLEAPDE